MTGRLFVHGYAACGTGTDGLPPERVTAMAPAGPTRGGGRIPRLALTLAQRALGERELGPDAGVLFGSGLGCQTETESFVAHMIRAAEATPKPRAFSVSVHNAIASFVALKLGAHGECQTFVHGETSFAQALFAAASAARRAPDASFLVGALDEAPIHTFLDLARDAGQEDVGEGGAVFVCGPDSQGAGGARAYVERVAFGRPTDVWGWVRAELGARWSGATLHSAGVGDDRRAPPTIDGGPVETRVGRHASSLATTTALAVALLAEDLPTELVGQGFRTERLAVLGTSARGDAALIVLGRC